MANLISEAQELMKQKDNLEKELEDLEEGLRFQGVGMDQPLIDSSGFPRSDVDVAAARVSRNQIHRLRNDYKALMTEIENTLHAIHEAKRQQDAVASVESTETPSVILVDTPQVSIEPETTMSLEPFAVVNAVAPDSPAYSAGLRRGDKIVKFGSVNAENHNRLQALNELVQQSLGLPIAVTVRREDDQLELTLVPRQGWGGRGSLGCHIIPV
ncbi:putative 26S proteasome non-ATPase regulatory subunit Nas2 [Phycomyces nitens]|nr:putative 26S proteasome non-ATPase regulatory subunit Nas2 [Phycomyces nitens]